jgi:iron complex transport system substrate-binding protein
VLAGQRVLLAGVALALLPLASGCGERHEPIGARVPLYPVTVVDARRQTMTLDREPQRVASLDPGLTSVLAALGAPARGSFKVCKIGRPACIATTNADLVLATSTVHSGAETHIQFYVAPTGSISDFEQAILEIGLLVGRPVDARLLVHRLESDRARVGARLQTAQPVSVFLDTGFFSTMGTRGLVGDLLHEVRARNVAGPDPPSGPFDLRKLERLDPDVYLATQSSGTTLAALRADPHTRGLTAVRTGRFATIGDGLLEPGPQLGTALLLLARILHPDAFR